MKARIARLKCPVKLLGSRGRLSPADLVRACARAPFYNEGMLFASLMLTFCVRPEPIEGELAYLKKVAHEVVDSAMVLPGAGISNGGKNTTGHTVRVPGGTQDYYPAFWIRDAAMMLGADLVPADELEGWIRVVAATQPGPDGIDFPHGLRIPPYSVPDHITLKGEACWFPGAYADQGVGNYGFLPPADDAFYFVQMAWDYVRLTGKTDFLKSNVRTGWGEQPLADVCGRAFESVEADPKTGLVLCSDIPRKGRVDWGFCDSISKSGVCLMPSLLRWQASNRLSQLFSKLGNPSRTRQYRAEASLTAANLVKSFYRELPDRQGMLVSATELGRKDDLWASAFAIWLGVLPRRIESAVARHLLAVIRAGGTVIDGQVRHLPPSGEFGGYWEKASSGHDTYQNGGFWATPTGWLIVALGKVDRQAATKLLSEYVSYIRANRSKGAPFEWINPNTKTAANGNYASSAGLVYSALSEAGFYRQRVE